MAGRFIPAAAGVGNGTINEMADPDTPTSRTKRFTRADLGTPGLVQAAIEGPVEVNLGPGEPALIVDTTSRRQVTERHHRELHELSGLLVDLVAALGDHDLAPLRQGDLAFLVSWTPAHREWFRGAFGEALAASLRAQDATPARELIRMAGNIGKIPVGRGISGELTPEGLAELRERMPQRWAGLMGEPPDAG